MLSGVAGPAFSRGARLTESYGLAAPN